MAKRITIQSAKSKGRNLQKWTRDRMRDFWPQFQDGDIESCPMGSNGCDVILSPAARDTIRLSVECKARAKGFTGLYDYLEQAQQNDGRLPVAIVKQDRRKPLAIVDAEAFFAAWASCVELMRLEAEVERKAGE